MTIEKQTQQKFENLSVSEKADYIIKERTPSPEQVIYNPTVEFLDPEGDLTREERARVVAMGDRTALSYNELKKKVLNDRNTRESEVETTDKTASFFQMYALAARSSNEIAHTSILEQLGAGPEGMRGDPPIIIEGVSILSALRDVCSQRYGAFEAFSSRGGIFPDKYWRVPEEVEKSRVGVEIEDINEEIHQVYLDLTKKGLEEYLKTVSPKEGEKSWQYRWRVLNLALDDSRQVTNGSFLNHLSYHPNSALALRETISELSSSSLPETVMIADKLRDLAKAGLPNIMQYTEASEYVRDLNGKRKAIRNEIELGSHETQRGVEKESAFILGAVTTDAERVFLSAFLAKVKETSYDDAFWAIKKLDGKAVQNILDEIFKGIGLHDSPPKELESIKIRADMTMSLGGIYELIRHRCMTHVLSGLSVENGYTIPPLYKGKGLESEYKYAMSLNERAFDLVNGLGPNYSEFASYYVARGHVQPVTIFMNGYDAFHFLKIRASEAAHPDIRKPAFELENFLRRQSSSLFRYLVKK